MSENSLKKMYHVVKVLIALDFLLVGFVFLFFPFYQVEHFVQVFIKLDFPLYLVPVIGVCKIAGGIGIWLRSLIALFAWAGIGLLLFFAAYAHICVGDTVENIMIPSVFLLISIWGALLNYKLFFSTGQVLHKKSV